MIVSLTAPNLALEIKLSLSISPHWHFLDVSFFSSLYFGQWAQQNCQPAKDQAWKWDVLPKSFTSRTGWMHLPGNTANSDCRGELDYNSDQSNWYFFQFQNIVYQEYLPLVVGPKMMEDYRLDIRDRLTKYNPNTDPRVSNEFSTVDKISHKFSFLICLKGCLSFWSFPSSARV